ncbi:hypothetical protein B0H63DRAFT_459480 [Podospora didyma]|uniref:Uncharacterized protein n=1 Tax=Podospora didyma TaxID=330526 RepID=A0AAE0U7I6_9PEZI|nr:hypothetical protein B0H63DRAFT_459480 [Podospora didyma]
MAAYNADSGVSRGIPRFRLQAMKNDSIIGEWIRVDDEYALSFLRDVRVEVPDETQKGSADFKVIFDFRPNPCFTNPTLTKEFIYKRDNRGETMATKELRASETESFFNFFETTFRKNKGEAVEKGEILGTKRGKIRMTVVQSQVMAMMVTGTRMRTRTKKLKYRLLISTFRSARRSK